ncbi:hypothetical protein M1D68_19875 [Pseudomonas sp. R4-84]
MVIDDDTEQHDPEKTSEAFSNDDGPAVVGEGVFNDSNVRSESEGADEPNSLSDTVVIGVGYGGMTAELRVRYIWDPEGLFVECYSEAYKVSNNGRHEGNIRLYFEAQGSWGPTEITNDNARQDGLWHNIYGGGRIAATSTSVVIGFGYTFDTAGGDPSAYNESTVNYVRPIPSIHKPQKGQEVLPCFTLEGQGVIGKRVRIHQANGGAIAHEATVKGDGWWDTTLIQPIALNDSFRITCSQYIAGRWSDWSVDTVVAVRFAPPVIDVPANGSIVNTLTPRFSGSGADGAQVYIRRYTDGGEISGGLNVQGGAWSGELNQPLNWGTNELSAQQKMGSVGSQLHPRHIVNVRARTPVITGPDRDVPQNTTFTLSGTGGVPGTFIHAYRYLGDESTEVGNGRVTADAWSCEVRVTPGGESLVVSLKKDSVDISDRSNPVAFKIKPPKLTDIQVDYSSENTVSFSGTGYNGARVDLHIQGNGTPQDNTDVASGAWQIDWRDQPPESYRMHIRQSITDGAGGRIYSDWADIVPVTIPVPIPTLYVQPGQDRKPVFSGTGRTWDSNITYIELHVAGPVTPEIPEIRVNGVNWSYTPTAAWPPGSYGIEARQVFKGVPSLPTVEVTLVLPAPPPVVNVGDNGLEPNFSGTCLAGAQVNLSFEDDPDSPYPAIVDGTDWTFTRPEAFMPGAYLVSVTQTINLQTSVPVERRFNVAVLTPVITAPIDVEVDHNPVVHGTGGVPGAIMRVLDAVSEVQLGQASVEANEWSVTISQDLPFGTCQVIAVQEYNLLPSPPRSQQVGFTVILFPPTIEHPEPGGNAPRGSVIDGYARKASELDTAKVELWLDGCYLGMASAASHNGYWAYNVKSPLPVGKHVLRAKQIFGASEVESDFLDREFITVPAIPVIESPALQQHTGATVTISGFGFTGDWVVVAWSDALDPPLGRTQVQANRTWSLQVQADKPAGQHSWVVRQECDGYDSGWSEGHSVRLLSQAPLFTAPPAGHWFAGAPLFEGEGDSGKTIELSHWYDSHEIVVADLPVTDSRWTASPTVTLNIGPHWFKARQDDSDWGDSLRVEKAKDAPDIG